MHFNSFQSMSGIVNHPQYGDRIGAGRHGTVFRTVRGGRDVALKVAPSGTVGRHEAEMLVRFAHPHVVDLVEHPIEGAPLVLEYCAGGTLDDLLRRGERLDSDQVETLLLPIIDALRHIHTAGWIHGDVSPANIGLREDGQPVLLDFGASRPADGSWITEGTPEFVGPLRQATPTLDTRGLAAIAAALLAPEHRWDTSQTELRVRLDHLISEADAGGTCTIDDLAGALAIRSQSGGSGRSGRTIPFGPSPRRPADASPADERRSRRSLLLLPIVLVVAFAFGTDLFGSDPVEAAPAASALEVSTIAPAEQSLAASGVRWSTADGTLLHEQDLTAQLWRVGQAGDQAAVGRWGCSSDATLGVYRPSTGDWFVFDSWDNDAISSAPVQLEANRKLAVESRGRCDIPHLMD